MHPQLSRSRIGAAFAVALFADTAQLPINLIYATGVLAVPAEAVDLCIDVAVCAIESALLGFHWTLLPAALIEAVPLADGLPTWTVTVGTLVWIRQKEAQRAGESAASPNEAGVVVASRREPRMDARGTIEILRESKEAS